jgi:uncharacterized protein (DUF2267 family)
MKLKEFITEVQDKADLDSVPKTEKLIAAVFNLLSARLTDPEEKDLIAQFPKELRALWENSREKEVGVVKFKKKEFISRVKAEGNLADDAKAEKVISAVFSAIKARVSGGESKDVEAQLPEELKRMWRTA